MTVDLGALWLATPELAADLGPSSTQLLWINDVYGFAVASLLVLSGNLGDRYGHRRLLLSGICAFVLVSVTAAYAPGPGVLIAARAILGAAGAAILPATLSLISHMSTDPAARARAIALWVTALSSGIAVGPVASGVLLEHFWWGSVFLAAVPVMAPVLVVAPVLVPRQVNAETRRLDWIGAPLLLLTVLPLVYAIKSLGEHGPVPGVVAALAAGLAFGVTFLRRQRRVAAPLLDVRLFGDRTFTAALAGTAFAVMATLPADGSGAVPAIGAATAMMVGLAPITVLGTGIASAAAPPSKNGQASSVGQTAYELGLAFGIAATGSLMASVYRRQVHAGAPADAPADAVSQAAGNLGGGLSVTERLPGELGQSMAAAVRTAFTSGLHAAAIVSSALSAALIVFVLLLLKRVAPTGAPQPASSETTRQAPEVRETVGHSMQPPR
ncbi:MFS transporter [Streptomyces sp. NPDC007100]|uniref:MFS transporter n=1 Tax=Streptomyces sp. NPDC007100 TaxID=3155602 RepID=UPI0033D3D8CF